MKKRILLESSYLVGEIKKLPFYGEVVKNGGKIYVVGGAVRDELIGKVPKDIDFVISGIEIETLKFILKKYGSVKENLVGKKQAVLLFSNNEYPEAIEIALPRTEIKTGEGYHGFDVNINHNLSIEDDLYRRDLGINSMAVNDEGLLIDPYGGIKDIKTKVIRATSEQAFIEDPLRMLRAVQFACRFNFTIEPKTYALIKENAPKIKNITKERYKIELKKMITKGDISLGIKLLIDTGLFEYMFYMPKNVSLTLFHKVKDLGDLFFLILKYSNIKDQKEFYNEYKLENEEKDRCDALKVLDENLSSDKANNLFQLFLAHRKDRNIFESGLVPQALIKMSKDYPMKISDLAISGEDLIRANVPQKERGLTFITILKRIYSDTLLNDRPHLLGFLNKQSKLA